MKVIGIENVNYNSKKTGKPVSGIALHCSYEKDNVKGEAVERYFISAAAQDAFREASCVALGDEINVFFNRYGNISGVVLTLQTLQK